MIMTMVVMRLVMLKVAEIFKKNARKGTRCWVLLWVLPHMAMLCLFSLGKTIFWICKCSYGLQLMLKKICLKKTGITFVAHLFALLLLPFAFYYVIYFSCNGSLKTQSKAIFWSYWIKMMPSPTFVGSSDAHFGLNSWPIWTQKTPKEA